MLNRDSPPHNTTDHALASCDEPATGGATVRQKDSYGGSPYSLRRYLEQTTSEDSWSAVREMENHASTQRAAGDPARVVDIPKNETGAAVRESADDLKTV